MDKKDGLDGKAFVVVQILMRVIKRIAKLSIAKFYSPLKPLLYFFMPKSGGVKVVIFYKNKLLLIRNTYRKGWTFPGGGVKKNESLEQAAIREVYEEVKIPVGNLKNRGSITLDFKGGGKVTVFSCKVKSFDLKIDNLEIEEAMWVDVNEASRLQLLPVATQCAELLKLFD